MQLGQVHSLSSRQGTQREYETVMIMHSATGKPELMEFVKKMQGVFATCGAQLIKIENWGRRTLSYPIKSSKTGIYLYWQFLGGSNAVAEFERNLQITDHVLRYYTVKIDEDIDPNARPSEVTEDLLHTVCEPPPEPQAPTEKARGEFFDDRDDELSVDTDDDDVFDEDFDNQPLLDNEPVRSPRGR